MCIMKLLNVDFQFDRSEEYNLSPCRPFATATGQPLKFLFSNDFGTGAIQQFFWLQKTKSMSSD